MKRLVLVSALALALASPLPAQQMLNLRDADIRAFIQDAARVTGRTFIIDSRVQGKVSVVTDRPLSRAEYLEVFLSTLRANGLVAVPTAGGAFRVQPADTAAAQPGRVGTRGSSNNSFVTEVFRLQTIDAASAMETIRPLVSREGSVTANRTGNAVVVADFGDNIRRIRDLLSRIDRDAATTRVVALRNAGAREIAQSLQALAGAARGGGGDGAAAAAAGPGISVVAIDSSNSIALRGDPRTVARLAQIAEDLDRRAASGSEIRVIFLEHADAGQLLPVLQQLVGQPVTPATSSTKAAAAPGNAGGGAEAAVAPASASAAPVGKGQPVIARFEGANAIVVSATSDMQRTLGEVIRQLDTRREQVLVEAIIVEISDNAARKLGVQFLLGGVEGSAIPFAATNYSNTAPNLLTIAGAIGARDLAPTTTTVATDGTKTTTTGSSEVADQLAQAAVNSILGAGGGFFGLGGKTDNGMIFGAIVNAVRSDTESNILSTPSVMTLDNQEAKLLVGQEIPVTTGQALSNNFDNTFRTVQRQNVGIQLEVKPQINAGGAIKLFLRQEVSSIAGPVSNDNSELVLNKREIETTVTVDDGEIIALGGLLDDNERKTIERIPLLSDIPVVGELFKSRSRSRVKTNLMVFIRPRIIRSAADARSLAEQRYGYIRGMQAAQRPEREPTIDEMVREYMGVQPPIPAVTGDAGVPVQPQVITPTMRSSTEVVRPVPVAPTEGQR
ncbi:type II secretion system protein D (GspD) [Sphingomonas laterariae]|uniref:Type II secretion system protein D (GspD) n=1 Tax=Edaphosphingomonas laterariae TaxID=861865 RepID=A0A239JEV9_9SPHN|nr:type II secretion system secretin GspD [Sphingomonas laterariae]SNT03968.1 type II secretion system protein D (GspD) [Sphingomonas laterariae]